MCIYIYLYIYIYLSVITFKHLYPFNISPSIPFEIINYPVYTQKIPSQNHPKQHPKHHHYYVVWKLLVAPNFAHFIGNSNALNAPNRPLRSPLTTTPLLPHHQGRCPRGQRLGPDQAEPRQRCADETPATARGLGGHGLEALLRRRLGGGKIWPEMKPCDLEVIPGN